MALLSRFDPPAFLPDFLAIPGQMAAWHSAMSAWFDAVIRAEQRLLDTSPQYYNAANLDPGGISVEQAVTWNAFPKELIRRYGRDAALWVADQPWPIERYRRPSPNPTSTEGLSGILYRPQEEYCEWHAVRDPHSNKILKLSFTSEPPEYWQALFGLVSGDGGDIPDAVFPGDKNLLLHLYRTLVSPDVQLEDLIAQEDRKDTDGTMWVQKGQYDIYNKWNTTHGIAHLCSPPNSLVAEIQLGGDATVLRNDPGGKLLIEPDALICYAGYGGPNRNSDPTIGSSVNALARLGAYVTLRNPVGLYMDHIDLAGWEAPDGKSLSDCVRVVRGTPDMMERLEIEVPQERNFCVGDITIAGEPLHFGGQVAECITVKLIGIANIVSPAVVRTAVDPVVRSSIDANYANLIRRAVEIALPLPPGTVEAFRNQGARKTSTAERARAAMQLTSEVAGKKMAIRSVKHSR